MDTWVLDRYRFSYSLLAYIYKDFYKDHEVPEGIDMNFIVPDSAHFETEFGNIVVQVNIQHKDSLEIFCKRVSRNLWHSPEAFDVLLKWRCSQVIYCSVYDFLVICSIVSGLVLYYFEKRCYILAGIAAESLASIMINNHTLWADLSQFVSFCQFKSKCVLTMVATNTSEILEPSYAQNTTWDIAYMHMIFPKWLLKPDRQYMVNVSTVDILISEEEEDNYFEKDTSADFQCIDSRNADFDYEQEFNKYVRKVICKRCRIDCKTFLRNFLEKFKSTYG